MLTQEAMAVTQSAGVKGCYMTMNPLTAHVLDCPGFRNQTRRARRGDGAQKADVARRHWLLIDADPIRPTKGSATDTEKAAALTAVLEVRDFLTGLGWPLPLLCDSGNGFHLLYRIDLPVDDDGLVRRVLQELARRFNNAAVEFDKKVHDAPRITKLYGTRANKGEPTPERPHRWTGIVEFPQPLGVVPRRLLEEFVSATGTSADVRVVGSNPHNRRRFAKLDVPPDQRHAWARAYISKVPPAVEGQSGDKQTFEVACRLAIDFNMSVEEALPVMLEYNERCVPPWSEDDLRYKLEKAKERASENPDEVGRLLAVNCRPAGAAKQKEQAAEAGGSPPAPFLGTVPNYILADWRKAAPRPRPRDQTGRLPRGPRQLLLGLLWMLHREVVRQQCPTVCLPDVLLAQVVWGDRRSWPDNWRRSVTAWLLRLVRLVRRDGGVSEDDLIEVRVCGSACALHGHPEVRHRHFIVDVPQLMKEIRPQHYEYDFAASFMGVLDLFRFMQADEHVFDFKCAQGDDPEEVEDRQKEIDRHKQSGRLCAVYLPVLVFGPSHRVGLTREQFKILVALTRELTRNKRSRREDKAAVINAGKSGASSSYLMARCPFLEPDRRYVVFGGNGGYKRRHRRGRGYSLVGRTGGGWLTRAGFEIPDDEAGKWAAVRSFLTELRNLAELFGLVAAGWDRDPDRWYTPDDLIALTRKQAGRAVLGRCLLQVYTPADYLVRWRRYFADRMGFSHIPGGADEAERAPEPDTGVPRIESAADLDVWMCRVGMTDQELAKRLGNTRSLISGYRSGRRSWSRRFQARVQAVVAAWEP
jgi:hypothetical protein